MTITHVLHALFFWIKLHLGQQYRVNEVNDITCDKVDPVGLIENS